MPRADDTKADRSIVRQWLDDIRFWRQHGGRLKINDADVTDSWIADQLARARRLLFFTRKREGRD